MIVVDLATAMICFLNQCYPILSGVDTPEGTYTLQQRIVVEEMYRGSVLQFSENTDSVLAIHILLPGRSLDLPGNKRKNVTNGCINVSEDVYDQLLKCCVDETLVIKR